VVGCRTLSAVSAAQHWSPVCCTWSAVEHGQLVFQLFRSSQLSVTRGQLLGISAVPAVCCTWSLFRLLRSGQLPVARDQLFQLLSSGQLSAARGQLVLGIGAKSVNIQNWSAVYCTWSAVLAAYMWSAVCCTWSGP
jgi:hypothetical protein